MKPVNPHFPEVDSRFLSQTESLILNGKSFRLSRDYPSYLNKLKTAGINYFAVVDKTVAYFDTKPEDIRPGSIMSIDEELTSLPVDFLTMIEPNIKIIRGVTGRALESQGISIKNHGNRVSDI